MAYDLDGLRVRLLLKLGLPSTDARVQNTRLDPAINAGFAAVSTDFDWPWLFTSETINATAGVAAYALPADHVRTLWIADTVRAIDLDARQRRDLTRYLLKTGPPLFYSVYGAATRFGPVPDTNYTFSHAYTRGEPKLINGSDAPLMPEHFSELPLIYAAIELSSSLKDMIQRNAWVQDATGWKMRMKNAVRQEASTLRVRSRGDWAV